VLSGSPSIFTSKDHHHHFLLLRDMATTETGAACYRVTGMDEDDDKRSMHHRHGRKRYRSGTTGWGNTRITKRTKCRM
jgi:hypothetical protein